MSVGKVALMVAAMSAVATAPTPAYAQAKEQSQLGGTEANKAVVHRFLNALAEGDVATRNAIIDPAGTMHGLTEDSRLGGPFDDVKQACPMCAATSGLKIAIDMMVAEGDLVTVRSTWVGIYTGVYRGMAVSSARPIKVNYTNIYRIIDGRIVENWAAMDRLSLAEQLGFKLIPSEPTTP